MNQLRRRVFLLVVVEEVQFILSHLAIELALLDEREALTSYQFLVR